MQRVLHETCSQYVARRLSESWRIIKQKGFFVTLESPEGILRPVDLRNDVETLRPNAAGDECNIPGEVGADCPNHYQNVDEETPDDATTYVWKDGVKARDLYNITDHSVGSGTINFIKVYARCMSYKEPTNASLNIAIKTGGTAYESSIKTVTNDWANYSNQWATNPGNAHAWTWDEIDALQIGVALQGTGGGSTRCTQVYVEVDYTSVTHYGAATLSGVGNLTTAGSFLRCGAATLSGAGTLSALGSYLHLATASLTGTGSLSTLGQVFKLGAASLSGVGNLTTSAVAILAGKATLAGAGSLAAFGRSLLAGAATPSGKGSLVVSATIVLFGKATLSGVGTLSALGIRIATGIATLAGVGLLSAAAKIFDLMATLQAAQKKPDRLPYVEAKVYDFEQGIQRLHWTRLYEGSEPDNHHGIAFDGQGAMHRIRAATAANLLYRQKVSSPDAESDYTQWTLITDNCHGPCAIAASDSKIYIFYRKGDNTIRKYYSHNYGVDWTDAALSTYANVLSMAAAWWAAGDIVVCFCAKATELNAIVLDTSDQSKNKYTHSEPVNHPLLNTYGIGATYETDHMAIIFAGKEDASPYDFYALYRTQLSSAYNWLAWEYFITSPDGEDITFEYPDCHMPSSPQDYEQVQITAAEKFAGSTAYNMPLVCHSVRGSTFQEMAYTEPRPFLNISSTYGLRFASTASYWWLERPDGVWQATRAAGDPTDLSADVISLTHTLPSTRYALVITLDNHDSAYATPPQKRSEVVLKLGYKTSEGDAAVEVGRYWIDGWEWTSSPGLSTFRLFCLDGQGLSRRWSARYQMRWNQSAVSPKTVSDIMAALLCRWGIYYYNAGKPRSDPLDNLYPDFIVQPGTAGDAAIRRLLSLIPDGLVYEGYKAYPKDLESDEASSYTYGTTHVILKGSYGEAVPTSRIRAIGRDASDNRLLSSAFDWDLLALGIDDFHTDYDPNLVNTTRTQERADAILRRQALEAMAGQITVPTNVGQELYDVITVTDDRCGISGTKYRLIAIHTDYDRSRGIYQQALTLCAP